METIYKRDASRAVCGRTRVWMVPCFFASLVCWLSLCAPSLPASPRTFDAASRAPRTQHLSDRGAGELRTMLNVAKLAALQSERLTTIAEQAENLYLSMDYSLLWIHDGGLTVQAREINDRLKHAEEKGLDPDDYSGYFGD